MSYKLINTDRANNKRRIEAFFKTFAGRIRTETRLLLESAAGKRHLRRGSPKGNPLKQTESFQHLRALHEATTTPVSADLLLNLHQFIQKKVRKNEWDPKTREKEQGLFQNIIVIYQKIFQELLEHDNSNHQQFIHADSRPLFKALMMDIENIVRFGIAPLPTIASPHSHLSFFEPTRYPKNIKAGNTKKRKTRIVEIADPETSETKPEKTAEWEAEFERQQKQKEIKAAQNRKAQKLYEAELEKARAKAAAKEVVGNIVDQAFATIDENAKANEQEAQEAKRIRQENQKAAYRQLMAEKAQEEKARRKGIKERSDKAMMEAYKELAEETKQAEAEKLAQASKPWHKAFSNWISDLFTSFLKLFSRKRILTKQGDVEYNQPDKIIPVSEADYSTPSTPETQVRDLFGNSDDEDESEREVRSPQNN